MLILTMKEHEPMFFVRNKRVIGTLMFSNINRHKIQFTNRDGSKQVFNIGETRNIIPLKDEMYVTVLARHSNKQVKVGFNAPLSIKILREAMFNRDKEIQL